MVEWKPENPLFCSFMPLDGQMGGQMHGQKLAFSHAHWYTKEQNNTSKAVNNDLKDPIKPMYL